MRWISVPRSCIPPLGWQIISYQCVRNQFLLFTKLPFDFDTSNTWIIFYYLIIPWEILFATVAICHIITDPGGQSHTSSSLMPVSFSVIIYGLLRQDTGNANWRTQWIIQCQYRGGLKPIISKSFPEDPKTNLILNFDRNSQTIMLIGCSWKRAGRIVLSHHDWHLAAGISFPR